VASDTTRDSDLADLFVVMVDQHSRNPRAAARPHRSNAPTRGNERRMGGPLCRNDIDITGVGAVRNLLGTTR
jgi:hypothetical protein